MQIGVSTWYPDNTPGGGVVPAFSASFVGSSLPAGVGFTRAGPANYFDSTGARQAAGTNVARLDYNPQTLQPRGLLIEGTRTNYLLNSLAPVTQTTGTLPVGTFTLWIEGTGAANVAATTAVGTGFGVASAGSPINFVVMTAGAVTVTLSGSVTAFQLENGVAPSALITTTTGGVARAADVATITLGSWFNPAEGTIVIEYELGQIIPSVNQRIFSLYSSSTNTINSTKDTVGNLTAAVVSGGVTQALLNTYTPMAAVNTIYRGAVAYKQDDFGYSINGQQALVDNAGTVPTVLTLALGNNGFTTANPMFGWIRKIDVYATRLTNAQIEALSYNLTGPFTPVDTFIAIGQSNADGRGLVADLSGTLTSFYSSAHPLLKMYYKPVTRNGGSVNASAFNYDGEWWGLDDGHDAVGKTTHQDVGDPSSSVAVQSANYHGVELEIGYQYAQAYPTRELRIVKAAVGASAIELNWGVTNAERDKLYSWFKSSVWYPAKYAMEKEGKTPRLIGIFWMQGESDADLAVPNATYQGYLQALVTRLNAELGVPVPKIVIGGLSASYNTANGNAIKTAQASVAATNPNTVLLPTDGTGADAAYPLSPDAIHYNSLGLSQLGARLFSLLSIV